ncbi:MAG: putative O-glycosylation ligase, exosortase A system-associated [Rhodoferax sp.]|nr:putative O-glycosylation ligase, exosortase A system-associated [Rhodoferax sp.]
MRDLVFGSMLLALAGYALLHPWVGIMGWTWVSIMNPHALSWRLQSMPVAMTMALATFVGILITKDRRQFYLTPPVAVLMAFMLWMCITLPFSFGFDQSLYFWNRVMKIDLMILVAIVVLHSRKHITILAWVLAGSLGFYGVKGGIFTIATGGSYRVWGPEGSFIEGNNEVALALVIIIPVMRFLQLTVENVWIKRGLTASMILCAAAALGSHSRGALLALAAMATVLWWRSQNKLSGLILLPIVGLMLLSIMPAEWWERMGTIQTYQDDTSAGGRINAWWMAWNVAKSNLFGGGFSFVRADICAIYAPIPDDCRAAHSIYFMVLGEHGFIGLFLFLLMWATVWFGAGRLRVQGKKLPQTQWLSHLGAMSQVSLAGYAVGGAFLSLAYYDLPYNILLLVVLGCRWMDQKEWVSEAEEEVRALAVREAKRARLAGR